MNTTTPSLYDTATRLAGQGLTIIPARTDGTKAPAIAWKQHQHTPTTPTQWRQWFTGPNPHGLGILTGQASNHLEMIELEGRAIDLLDPLHKAVNKTQPGLFDRLLAGYLERTPSGGLHILYHVQPTPETPAPVPGNTRLAVTNTNQVLIETRGEGGFVVIAPTPGLAHPTGNPWQRLTPHTAPIPTITIQEHAALHEAARTLTQKTATPTPAPVSIPAPAPAGIDTRPGDAYNQAASWHEILTPHGWQHHSRLRNGHAWTRPNKKPCDGISATTGQADDGIDRLYVFTTSTSFEPETPYTKFAAYTHLNHGGDWHAATLALAGEGYGTPAHQTGYVDLSTLITPTTPTTAPTGPTDAPTAPTDSQDTQGSQDTPTAPTAATDTPTALTDSQDTPTTTTETTHIYTDDHNALQLAKQHQNNLRYNTDTNRWHQWNGHTWQQQPRNHQAAREAAKTLARTLPSTTKPESQHKKYSLSNTGITNTLNMAQTHPALATTNDTYNQHPTHLNTPHGPINLTTGQQLPPDPTHYHTQTTTTHMDKNQPTPKWDTFLAQTFKGQNPTIITYLQTLTGYAATGLITHHVLPFAHGQGGNGKSVFMDVIVALLGDYATTTPAGFLTQGQQRHETEIARLQHIRLAIASEVNETDRFDEAKIKQLTGGDRLTARRMREDHFTFKPTHKLWLMGNHQPRVDTGGESFWRRLRLIPFTNTVPKKDRNEHLAHELIEEEGPGILAWIVTGAVRALAGPLETPAEVKAATDQYRLEEDHLQRFIDERLAPNPHSKVPTAEVLDAYQVWCHREGHSPLNGTAFGRAIKLKIPGLDTSRDMARRYYTGVMLYSDPDADDLTQSDLEEWWNK